MAAIAGIFTSPGRKSGRSVEHERLQALAGQGLKGCEPCQRMDDLRRGLRAELEDKRGMLARVVESGEVAVGDAVELL